MPEIDIDVFQVLTLAGLAILMILVLALWSTVSKLSKAVKALTPGTTASSADTEVPVTEESSAEEGDTLGGALPTAAAVGAVSSSEEAVAASIEPEPEPAASQWSEPAAQEPAAAWGASTMAEEPVQTAAEPVAETAAEPVTETAAEPVAAAASASAFDELPEEQPFERGGRWWFKRGDELLVYEEQTGQWSAAPEGSFERATGATSEFQPAAQQTATQQVAATETAAPEATEPEPAAAETGAFISDESATAWRTDETTGISDPGAAGGGATESTEASMWGVEETAQAPAADEGFGSTSESAGIEGEAATFWKCPSCGAVNGSTASTCRMCFARRP